MRAPLHGQRRYTFPRRRGHRRHCLPSLDHTAASPSGSTRADKDWEPMWALSREGPRRRAGDGPRRHLLRCLIRVAPQMVLPTHAPRQPHRWSSSCTPAPRPPPSLRRTATAQPLLLRPWGLSAPTLARDPHCCCFSLSRAWRLAADHAASRSAGSTLAHVARRGEGRRGALPGRRRWKRDERRHRRGTGRERRR
jgi:hypothetical protein